MSAMSTGYICDGDGCVEFHRGATFPSAVAAQTWRAAFEQGWRKTGNAQSTERRDMCPRCAAENRTSG